MERPREARCGSNSPRAFSLMLAMLVSEFLKSRRFGQISKIFLLLMAVCDFRCLNCGDRNGVQG